MPFSCATIRLSIAACFAAAITTSAQNSTNTAEPKSSTSAVFFSGNVALQDGSIPPEPVLIHEICDGRVRDSVWSDAQGRFSFKSGTDGSNGSTVTDATQPNAQPADMNKPFGNSTVYSSPVTSSLRNCELQAVLAGFRSEHLGIAIKSTLDNTRVGTLILYPLTHAGALTVSATTLGAPANAKKSFQKGMAAERDGKWEIAAVELSKAVAQYGKYAIAWYELGLARQHGGDPKGATEAWNAALQSDPKYVKPYVSLTALAYRDADWPALANYSAAWIKLDGEDFPAAYLYRAFANAKLNQPAEAEQAARQGLQIDQEHQFPRLHYVLGLMLLQRGENGESANCLRAYLNEAPNASDAALVRDQLQKLDSQAAATGQKATP